MKDGVKVYAPPLAPLPCRFRIPSHAAQLLRGAPLARVDSPSVAVPSGLPPAGPTRTGGLSQEDVTTLERTLRRVPLQSLARRVARGASVRRAHRIDQRALPLSTSYAYGYTGEGITVYVVDTGIRYDHEEFEGRATFGYDAFGGDGSDCRGHGTHVAGIIGGKTYGVAKKARLVSVRVLDCEGKGSSSGTIAALDWIAAKNQGPAVANMSLGSAKSESSNEAVARLIASGVQVFASAGNDNVDACTRSPASAPDAVTTGSTTSADAKSSFSNWGSCVDLFAPGSGVLSASYTGPSDATTKSGTSMAAPHAAGVGALYLHEAPLLTPADLRARIRSELTQSVVTNSNTANNHLLFSLRAATAPVPPPSAPTASTSAAAEITSTGAMLHGSVNPNGSPTDAWFEYTADASWVSFSTAAPQSMGSGSDAQSLSQSVAGLSAATVYYFRAVARNAGGTSRGTVQSFTTSAAPSSSTIQLTAAGYKDKAGLQKARLDWIGATNVVVYRDGTKRATAAGTSYIDDIGKKGGGTYVYRVCNESVTPRICSNDATVAF